MSNRKQRADSDVFAKASQWRKGQSTEQTRDFLQKAGIIDVDGKLSEPYATGRRAPSPAVSRSDSQAVGV